MLNRFSSSKFLTGLFAALLVLALGTKSKTFAAVSSGKTENVFLIISDGLRWQEVFSGAEERLLTRENGGVTETNLVRARFWRETPETRREVLLPFIWGEVSKKGQILGNQRKENRAVVTNGKKFSYPGYNEMLTGAADARIDSNDKKPNPNITVFEWLNRQPDFSGKVSIFATWDAFPYIFNCERSGLPIWPSWDKAFKANEIPAPEHVQTLMRDTTPYWHNVIYDSFLFHSTMAYVERARPRVVFVGFGETDEWGHSGRYDLYLTAAQHLDMFVRRLWEKVQSIPAYRDKTTFLISTDHGRGSGISDWKDHGEKVADSEGIWMAVMGPDTPNLGERSGGAGYTQSQIAATLAAFLGKDFCADFPKAAAPMLDLIKVGN